MENLIVDARSECRYAAVPLYAVRNSATRCQRTTKNSRGGRPSRASHITPYNLKRVRAASARRIKAQYCPAYRDLGGLYSVLHRLQASIGFVLTLLLSVSFKCFALGQSNFGGTALLA